MESNGGLALMATKRDAEDWQLQPSIVRKLAVELVDRDSFDVDLFATEHNSHCNVFFTK